MIPIVCCVFLLMDTVVRCEAQTEDVAFLSITATYLAVSKQLHATWLHLVIVSRYLIPRQVEYEKWTTFLGFCPRNSRLEHFSWTKFCVIWLVVASVKPAGFLMCLGFLSCWITRHKGVSSTS